VPTVDAWMSEEEFAYFSGVHEAYERLENRVSGAGKLFYCGNHYWILIDRFYRGGRKDVHTYRSISNWAFRAGSSTGGGDAGRRRELYIRPVEGARARRRISPCPWPMEGYFNPSQLVFTQKDVQGHALFVSVLAPFTGPGFRLCARNSCRSRSRAKPCRVEATGLEIMWHGQCHVYVDQHMHWNLPWECSGYASKGRVFHSAVSAGRSSKR